MAKTLPQPSAGALNIAKERSVLTAPPGTPTDQVWRYGCGFPLQVAPRLAGVLASIQVECTRNYGFLNGNDLVLCDDLEKVSAGATIPLNRNEYSHDPATGQRQLLLRSPLMGGFVPLRAARADGSAHPHAGTGFGVCQAHSFPCSQTGQFLWWNAARRDYLETYAWTYDGQEFTSEPGAFNTQNADSPLGFEHSPWHIVSTGISMAIPDQDDLLLPVLAAALDGSSVAVGVARWVRRNRTWRAATFTPVAASSTGRAAGANFAEQCPYMEPSLVRAGDGGLLFSARGQCDSKDAHLVHIWQSCDGGHSWQTILYNPQVRNDAPVSVNCATDGAVYVASTPYDPNFVATPQTGRGRNILALWPVDIAAGRLAAPLIVLDALSEFGPPPAAAEPGYHESWMVDHPNAATVQLADGKWRHLLVHRLAHTPLYHSAGTFPAPVSGCYLEQIYSQGPEIAPWRFLAPLDHGNEAPSTT